MSGGPPVRQESLVEEEGGSDLKLRTATQGESPTGDGARPPRRKRVLRDCRAVHGRPWSRSVDSGRAGHVIGSRNPRVAGAEPSRGAAKAKWMRRCATSKAERRGLERIRQPGSQNAACTQGSPRNLGWSLDALSGDRNDTARGTKPVGRREVGARSKSCDAGELAPGDPAEQRSAPENKLVGGRR